MNEPIVQALHASLAVPFLLVVPGLTALSLLPRKQRQALAPDEAVFLSVALSVMLSAWLGLLLAEWGAFSILTAGAILGVASAAALLLGRRRLGGPVRRPAGLLEWMPAVVVLCLAVTLQARPSEYIVGGRDPGAYIAAMGMIGRTGGVAYIDPVVQSIPARDRSLFYRHPEKPDYSWARFLGFDLENPKTGRVTPQFFHLFPAFGAYLFQAMGVKGALATPPVFGILGTLAVFFALRRTIGSAPAFVGSVLLGLNVVQVWFARYPMSEMTSQFLVFVALLALSHWEERGGAFFGAVCGGALGLTLLVRIDSVLVVAPLGAYVLIQLGQRQRGWRALAPMLLAFLAFASHATVHALLFSRKYVLDIVDRPYWRQPLAVWVGLVALGLLALVLAPRVGAWLETRARGRAKLIRQGVAGAIVLLAAYAYFLRPELSAWAGGDGNDAARRLTGPFLETLQSLGFRRLAAHDAQAFLRLGWFVTPLALVLGIAGLVLMLRDWRPRYLFPVLLILAFGGFYFYKIRVFNDYYFALRRYVPVVLPGLFGCSAFALWRIWGAGARAGSEARRISLRALAATTALVLALLYGRDTARIYAHVDWKGTVGFTEDVARRFGPEDIVVFEQTESIHLLSLPLWSTHGVNILELARFNPDPRQLDHLVESWRERYKNIYFVYTYRSDLCSLFLQRVDDFFFPTTEWARGYSAPPTHAVGGALRFTLARAVDPERLQVPPLPTIELGGTDDPFVSAGFFGKEGGGEKTFRWTGRCASIYLPAAKPGAILTLTAAAGTQRPSANPPHTTLSLSGVELGRIEPGATLSEHVLRLPDPLPPGPPVLRIDVPDWRPINELPDSQDTRDLGIMISRVRVDPAPPKSRDSMPGLGRE